MTNNLQNSSTDQELVLCSLTAVELIDGYRERSISPVEVTKAVLQRAEKLNGMLNALYYIDTECALKAAHASQERWARGEPLGLLDGVPACIKDSVAVAGMPMLRGAAVNRGKPAPETDAPPVARMREHGAVIFGKTTMPDLGLLGASASSAYGLTYNPWNTAYNAGGSSSGSSAAVAARIGPISVGTDLGGSVRLPAGLCGLSTIKPTQGVVPHLPPSATRSAGPIARNVTDAALLLTALSGSDPYDFGSYPSQGIQYHEQLQTDMRGWRVGILDSIGGNDTTEPVILETLQAAAKLFEAAGATVTNIPRVIDFDFVADLKMIFGARGLSDIAGLTQEQRATLHPVVQATTAATESLSAKDYLKSVDAIERAKKAVVAATYPFDVVISPVSPVVNFPVEEVGPVKDDFTSFIHFTAMFNQTGQPAAVAFAGVDARGLPIGLQFVGRRFDDLKTLQAASFFERQRGDAIPWPL